MVIYLPTYTVAWLNTTHKPYLVQSLRHVVGHRAEPERIRFVLFLVNLSGCHWGLIMFDLQSKTLFWWWHEVGNATYHTCSLCDCFFQGDLSIGCSLSMANKGNWKFYMLYLSSTSPRWRKQQGLISIQLCYICVITKEDKRIFV